MITIKNQYLNFKQNSIKVKKRNNKKKIVHSYFKPKNYYNRLITFFIINSIILTLTLLAFENNKNIYTFLLIFIIILFLMLALSTIIEYFYMSEYMDPFEVHRIENFFRKFLKSAHNDPNHYEKEHYNKYDSKTRIKFEKLFNKKHRYFLSSIKKKKETYEITFINNNKLFEFFILKFLIKNAIHKAYIKKIDSKYKIIGFD